MIKIWTDLAEVFPEADIEWRLQQSGDKSGKIWGKCLAYVTNRAIMQRLDDVIGPDKWKNEFQTGPHGGVLCGISIKVGDEWVVKFDGAENTAIEAIKGGLSGAMKRAAVQWGIGRYLYNLEEGWVTVDDKGKFSGKLKTGKYFKWNPPSLPIWAVPEGTKKSAPKSPEPKKTPSKPLSQEQRNTIATKCKDKKITSDELLKHFQRDSMNDFTVNDFANILMWIEKKFNGYVSQEPVDIEKDLFGEDK